MTTKQLTQLIEYAALAPSVHNTQPWRFCLANNRIELLVDPASVLKYGDPSKRQLWISLGACVENLHLAATELGFKISNSVYHYPTRFDNQPIARFDFTPLKSSAKSTWLKPIKRRLTNRHAFQARPISAAVLSAIQTSWRSANTRVVVGSDKSLLQLLGKLTRQGMTMALGHPKFRAELNELVHFNWKRTHTGLPGYVLKRNALGSVLEKTKLKTGLATKRQAATEGKLIAQAPAVILIFSKGDVPKYWLEAGRAYQRTVLKATSLELHNATTAAVVEAGDFHEDIEDYVGTAWRLQAIARIGYSKVKRMRHSPRLPINKLLIT